MLLYRKLGTMIFPIPSVKSPVAGWAQTCRCTRPHFLLIIPARTIGVRVLRLDSPRVCMEVDVPTEFRLLMISAMYENGGNTTQRLLDGHPELFSYPFESQPGSKYVLDHLTSTFPVKYRWPVFPLSGTVEQDYETIIDEECKVRIKTPQSSKFRDYPMQLSDKDRKASFVKHMQGLERTRGNLVAAFYKASADAWLDYKRSGREHVHVGY